MGAFAGQGKLQWAWRRLGRMSPAEVAHRAVEQLKRRIDRTICKPWFAFGRFEGAVGGLPIFDIDAAGPAFLATLAREARATEQGRFIFLGRRWPVPLTGAAWWDGDLWLTDQVSGRLWPGAASCAFDIDYRQSDALGDVKFVWELNRLQVLPSLALQARLSGDGARGTLVFRILRGWMRANPPGRGVNWTSGIEAATRVISLLAALAFVAPETTADEAAVRAFLDAHVRWIARYPCRFSSANNHRVAELVALFLAGIAAPGLAGSARRTSRAQAELEQEMLRQFRPDGVGAEQSTAYAAYALEWFVLAGAIGDAAARPFSKAFRTRMGLAADHLCWLTDEGGRTIMIGDDDHSRVLALTQAPEPRYAVSVAAMAARWLKTPQPPATHRDPALRDLVGASTPAALPLIGLRTFEDGGMSVWRRPRTDGALLLAFDYGPLGHLSIAAHGHADALAVRLHWGEEAVLVSPGTHLYHAGGEVRDALRGTRAHNTLALANEDQSRIIGPFAWSHHAEARLIEVTENAVEAEHDGYLRRFGLIHRRRMRCDGDAILIEDHLLGRAPALRIPWSLGFTLAPGVQVEIDGVHAHLCTPKGRRLSITPDTIEREAPLWTLVQTPYAPTFGVLATTGRLELSGAFSGRSPIALIRIDFTPSYQDRPA